MLVSQDKHFFVGQNLVILILSIYQIKWSIEYFFEDVSVQL